MTTAAAPPTMEKPTRVRYGVLGFACSLSMITYLDRVCFGSVAKYIQSEFGLTFEERGRMFAAFGLAYALFEIPTGWLGDRFGARKTLIRIVLWWSVFTALTGAIYPSLTGAFAAMLVVRFLFGMGEAGAYPNIAHAFHSWFPAKERGFVKGAVWMAGRLAGGVTPLLVLALLDVTEDARGVKTTHWRHIFWIFGGVGSIWCLLFWLWFRDRPEHTPGVNRAELDLINEGQTHSTTPFRVPWLGLLCDRNLWALCIIYFMGAFGWYFNITYLPDYLKDFWGFGEPEKWSAQFWLLSLMTGLPLLMGSAACLVGGFLSDLFIRTTGNRKWGRRLFGIVGHGIGGLCFFSAIFMHSAWGVVLAVSFAAFFNDLTMGASWASCLDIGGKYSGIVAGCMNSIGNLGGTAAMWLTGLLMSLSTHGVKPSDATFHAKAAEGWNVNFVAFGVAYIIAMVLWCFFDSTKHVKGARD